MTRVYIVNGKVYKEILDAVVAANESDGKIVMQVEMLAMIEGEFTPEFIEASQAPD